MCALHRAWVSVLCDPTTLLPGSSKGADPSPAHSPAHSPAQQSDIFSNSNLYANPDTHKLTYKLERRQQGWWERASKAAAPVGESQGEWRSKRGAQTPEATRELEWPQ